MTVSMVFNDLCLCTHAPDRTTARQWMTEFVDMLITATDHNLHILRMHIDFADIVLLPEYPLRAWFNVIAQPGSNKERTGERAFWMA
jgi:hypothetical protein